MPTATDALRAKMKEYFGDEIDDAGPYEFLLRAGFTEDGGFWEAPNREVTQKEWDCVDFLCQEWDYGFRAGRQA